MQWKKGLKTHCILISIKKGQYNILSFKMIKSDTFLMKIYSKDTFML